MNDITSPLRLAVGSHQAGSGKGCAMNVISWESGDATITDLPECADLMLAKIVQWVNDGHCTHRVGDLLLCAPCSVEVLALAHRTSGTALTSWTSRARADVYAKIAREQADSVAHLRNTAAVNADTAAVNAAYADVGVRLTRAHAVIDRFLELTGITPTPVAPEVTDFAVYAMAQVRS